jgi:hypothetical protein
MIAAVVIGVCVVTLLRALRAKARQRAALPASAPPEHVGMHGALVARRH